MQLFGEAWRGSRDNPRQAFPGSAGLLPKFIDSDLTIALPFPVSDSFSAVAQNLLELDKRRLFGPTCLY